MDTCSTSRMTSQILTSITVFTPAGGLERDLTSTMSFLDRFFRLAVAASRAGRASSRSR